MDVMERIKQQIEGNSIVIFMKGDPQFPMCGFSARTSAAMQESGIDFAYVNVLADPEIRENLKVYSDWPTYPQLYINGELVGGHDIVMQLYESGELKRMMEEAGAKAS